MNRRELLRVLALAVPAGAAWGCGYTRIDPDHVLMRSDVIHSLEREREITEKARVEWSDDGRVRVLFVRGSPYERGYQHGKLLRAEVQDNLAYMYRQSLKKFHIEELFDEAYERARPFIPAEYVEEMHGLAHGARLPLRTVHAIHILPEIGEWGGKRKIKTLVQAMMRGEIGPSCSNFCVLDPTGSKEMYAVRVLDWGLHRISKLHQYPLFIVSIPDKGHASLNVSWVGFVGAISGMNEKGITLGEMGYGDDEEESLRGKPMPFLLRDVLSNASNLREVRKIISESTGTNRYVFLMSDGKSGEAQMYVRDKGRFVVFNPGQHVQDGKANFPAIPNLLYGGHYGEKMTEVLRHYSPHITPDVIKGSIIPQIAMPSNFQNVIYAPRSLEMWVNYAKSKSERAAEQPYVYFDFGKALAAYRAQAE